MRIPVAICALLTCSLAPAQHRWDQNGCKDDQVLYGEITVWCTGATIYYCGANWHPGEAAGGYCGIQHNSNTEKRTIFSIWDTSPSLHPSVTFKDPETFANRFGGEGEGGHTHMPWDWQTGEAFRFFVKKTASTTKDSTDCQYFVMDRKTSQWRKSATITSPNGGKRSVETIGPALASFLENFGGVDKAAPKIATYNLWTGPDERHLRCLTLAAGDGLWGTLGDSYFLAEGEKQALTAAFNRIPTQIGASQYGTRKQKLRIRPKPIPPSSEPLP
jgi:hypothetical protein